jgi:hypothetical protein
MLNLMMLGLLCLLAGCAGVTPQDSLQGLDLSSKDQVCARNCSTTYSSCVQNAGLTSGNRLVANDVLRACGGSLRICIDTCPLK